MEICKFCSSPFFFFCGKKFVKSLVSHNCGFIFDIISIVWKNHNSHAQFSCVLVYFTLKGNMLGLVGHWAQLISSQVWRLHRPVFLRRKHHIPGVPAATCHCCAGHLPHTAEELHASQGWKNTPTSYKTISRHAGLCQWCCMFGYIHGTPWRATCAAKYNHNGIHT